MLRKWSSAKLSVVLCSFLFVISFSANSQTSQIVHDAVTSVATGERVSLTVAINDPSGVDIVRAYFKHESGANFHFVNMASDGGNDYVGELPAAAQAGSNMQYLILVKNSANQVYKTQSFTVEIVAGAAVAASTAPLQVFTELDTAPEAIPGFSDNLSLDVAESGAKYGAVAQLYGSTNATTAAAATGTANSGTVTAVSTANTNVAAGATTSASSSTSTAAASTTTTTTTTTAASTTATTTAATTTATTAATTTAAAAGAVSATTVAAGVAVAGGVAAAAGGGSSDDEPEPDPQPTATVDGTYTVVLNGSLSDNIVGDCNAGAELQFSNVAISNDSGSLTIDLGAGTLTGSFSGTSASMDPASISIEPGTTGFSSTDTIELGSFTATWLSDFSSFSTDGFTLDTFELGVNECTYSATLSGDK